MDFTTALSIFVALTGFPALLVILINVAKAVGWLKDGLAPVIVFWVNVAVFIGVAVLVFLGKIELIGMIDTQLKALSTVLMYFAAFATEIGLTKVFYSGLRGMPLVGYSHTLGGGPEG